MIIKRIEKLFPEEVLVEKSQMISEIRVPKNFMYLTDKLPGPSYEAPVIYKNKSESKFKLPKL